MKNDIKLFKVQNKINDNQIVQKSSASTEKLKKKKRKRQQKDC